MNPNDHNLLQDALDSEGAGVNAVRYNSITVERLVNEGYLRRGANNHLALTRAGKAAVEAFNRKRSKEHVKQPG